MLDWVNAVPLAGLMAAITLGWSLGQLGVRGLSLGPAGATLFVSLALGHLGLTLGGPPGIAGPAGASLGTLGFALFIYSVGFDAAPHFFASFRERRGFRFVAVGVAVNALALAATVVAARLLGFDPSTAAGVLAGALTSAPTFAAASEVAPDPARLAVAFALTFPFGLVGLVLAIQLVPRLLGEDLARSAASDEQLESRSGRRRARGEITRAFRVQREEVTGRPLRELDLIHATGCVISRVRAGEAVIIPDGSTVLEVGDRVMAVGRMPELREFELQVGPEAPAEELESSELLTRRIEVRDAAVVGRSLAELLLIQRYHCVVTRIERGALRIEPDPEARLVRGDVLTVVGRRDDLRDVARRLGRFEAPTNETDLAVYAGGIVLGLLLGAVRVRLGGLDFGLGMAGGLLAMGLLLGSQPRIGPLRSHVPREARQLVRDLGILLFVGETGLKAGAQVAAVLEQAAWQTFAAGAAVNAVAVLGALVLGRGLLGLRPVDAWGSLCGGLTSSAALQAVRRASESNEAAISYAAAYAVASVLATLAGPLVVLWVG